VTLPVLSLRSTASSKHTLEFGQSRGSRWRPPARGAAGVVSMARTVGGNDRGGCSDLGNVSRLSNHFAPPTGRNALASSVAATHWPYVCGSAKETW